MRALAGGGSVRHQLTPAVIRVCPTSPKAARKDAGAALVSEEPRNETVKARQRRPICTVVGNKTG